MATSYNTLKNELLEEVFPFKELFEALQKAEDYGLPCPSIIRWMDYRGQIIKGYNVSWVKYDIMKLHKPTIGNMEPYPVYSTGYTACFGFYNSKRIVFESHTPNVTYDDILGTSCIHESIYCSEMDLNPYFENIQKVIRAFVEFQKLQQGRF